MGIFSWKCWWFKWEINLSSDDSSAVEVTLSTDKINYNFDETAIIQGTVSEKIFVEIPTFQTAPILISISGPNFEQSVSLYPDNKSKL